MASIVSHNGVFEGEMCMGVTASFVLVSAEEILRFAQDDKRFAQDDKGETIMLTYRSLLDRFG